MEWLDKALWHEIAAASINVMNLLIVEDEVRMAELLRKGLMEEGHTATCAMDGAEGLEIAKSYEFDVIILDIMMPKMSGYELAKRLRQEKVGTPVLMLTAKDSVPDIVRGLDLGADDYMTKPFSFDELLARLRAVKRRALISQDAHLRVADLVLNPESREVVRGETRISLTKTEYNLLERLMYRAGKIVPRRVLIEAVWGFDRVVEDNTLDAFMRLLRNKIDSPGRPKLIHTVRGVGYMIRQELERTTAPAQERR
ncbi:MAG TPA: response regulator transcription factor [Verrucomicrobiae bacterium]|nr:response regulator transcription factor [Verrucomicrobiae bacterium]